MTKKGWTRILILVVASLWAYNIYKTIQNVQVQTEVSELNKSAQINFVPSVFNKDTFNLQLPKKDPFLGDVFASDLSNGLTPNVSPKTTAGTNQKPILTPIKQVIKWPAITYQGFLRKHGETAKLCILTIGNQTYRLKAGNIKENIFVEAVYSDSIILVFNQELKTFYK